MMYADDQVLVVPSVSGLNRLLRVCERFRLSHDVKYNSLKSAIMSFRSNTLKGVTLPHFSLNRVILSEVEKI